jgi:hypothetical protein
VHDYSKLFNHLAQHVSDQVDTDEKKKNRFMNDLSMKLQECMALNTGGSFHEFVSNVIIADNVIYAHKETKKKKAMAAPSGSDPPKYQMMYHHHPTYPHHQHQQRHQHQCQQQQWVSYPPQRQLQQTAPKALP